MIAEQWRDIPGYVGWYQVSDQGRIKRVRTGRILKTGSNGRGYHCVRLSQDAVRTTFAVHRLVAKAFIPRTDCDLLVVNHINGVKADNRLANLEWLVQIDNVAHHYGKPKKGLPEKEAEVTARVTDINPHTGVITVVCTGGYVPIDSIAIGGNCRLTFYETNSKKGVPHEQE